MPTRLGKTRKFRGSRSCGWGQSHAHRGAGGHGGFGKTGGHKHGWTYIVAHEPDHFGKHGFYHPHPPVISLNVGELDQLADTLLMKGQAAKKDEGIFIDLNTLGVDKLLGAGRVEKQLILKVKVFSLAAEKKIREAKGQILNA
ncbi:MAG: uL15 family ribosomal protein [Candidatus Bathyarchaeota archaeon]